jgi:hypothetical protein
MVQSEAQKRRKKMARRQKEYYIIKSKALGTVKKYYQANKEKFMNILWRKEDRIR